MDFIAFGDNIPDDLPITKAVVEKVADGVKQAKASGGALAGGVAQTGLAIVGLLSGMAELERRVIALERALTGQ
ncbi:hypothetical protein MMUC44124_26665 [Mycolicibacterium mucogenicum DSM 44124]|uniref:Uncharacterized protein n=1 Tax=Mycolicibacterium mucogenicum DSM 44124 TaxID=1226753 RepID=A0A8H2JGI3_MYCMU|nr:hypothetical protein MMUC44124_26665 [Mycolicibacterium mucogenicum DSM 44124]